MEIKTKLPRMGGGAIVSLLDKDGNEVYNSGFVQNDLTDAGINHVLGAYSRTSYPTKGSRNLTFQGDIETYPSNITKVIEVRNSEGKKIGTSPTLGQGGRGYDKLGGQNNPLETEDGKIFISSKFTGTFIYGTVEGSIKYIDFVGRDMIFSTIELPDEVVVTKENQLRIVYYRIAEVSEFLELDGRWLRKKELPSHDLGDGIKGYFNPLYVFSNSTNFTSSYNNFVGCSNFDGLRGRYLNFYLNGEKVGGAPKISNFPENTSITFNTGEKSYTLNYDFTIPPSTNVPEFDTIVFSETSDNFLHLQPYRSDNMSPKKALTIEFPEPIIKTKYDKLVFKVSVSVYGGKDSLDLSNIIPLLTD